jgi:hypothetical protein
MNNKISKLNKFSTSKNINFKHTNYGIVKSGMYKGLQIEIREFIPEKIEVRMGGNIVLTTRNALKDRTYDILNIVPARISGLMSDFTKVVLNADNIFYRDVYLKQITNDNINHYASVKKIIQKGSDTNYYIKGEIFKDNRYIEINFRNSDILEMMDNFKINVIDVTDDDIDDEKYIYEKEESGDGDSDGDSDSDSSSFKDFDFDLELDESEETFDDIITDEMKPSISDKSRTSNLTFNSKLIKKDDHIVLKFIEHILLSIKHKGKITSKLFSKKDDRIEELDKMNMVNDTSILTILENVKDKRKKMNTVLKDIKKSITVNTIDDMFIISSVVFMNLRSSLDYKEYIDYLLKSEYFGKNVNANLKMSIVLRNTDLFSCVINKKSIDIKDVVMNIGACFIKIIESYNETIPLSIKLQLPLQPTDYIKLKTSERKEIDKVERQKPILSIKDQLIYRKENAKNDGKRILYNYLIENIDNIENEISILRPQVVDILSNIFSEEFKNNYELCSEKRCREEIISNYIMMTFDKIKRNDNIVLNESDYMRLQKFIELNKIRILQNREKGVVEMDAPDYKKGELDVLHRERVKRFRDRIKKMGQGTFDDDVVRRQGSSSVNKKRKRMDNIKTNDIDMIRYLFKDIDLNKINRKNPSEEPN